MITKQEMFDRAVIGLRAQGFARSIITNNRFTSSCAYQTNDGKRCAWGHVDTSLTYQHGGVRALQNRRIGIAAQLSEEDLTFAEQLQNAHDAGIEPARMYNRLLYVAESYGLQTILLGEAP